MSDFLTNFKQICKEHGLAPTTVLKSAGLSNSLYTKWSKNPGSVPNLDTIKKIAAVLNVSTDDLAGTSRDIETSNLYRYPELRKIVVDWPSYGSNIQAQILQYIEFLTRSNR